MEPCACCGGLEEHQYRVGGMGVGETRFELFCVPLAVVAKGIGWNVVDPPAAAKEISSYAGKELFDCSDWCYYHCGCRAWGVVDDVDGDLHRHRQQR